MKSIKYLTPKILFVLCSLLSTQHSHTMWKEASENLKNNFEQLVFMASKGSFNLSPNQQYGVGVGLGLSGILLGSIKHRIDQYDGSINKKLSEPLTTKGKSASFEFALRLKAFDLLNGSTKNYEKFARSSKAGDINPNAIMLAAKAYLNDLSKCYDHSDLAEMPPADKANQMAISYKAKRDHIVENLKIFKQSLDDQKKDPIFSCYTNMKWYKKAWFGNSVEKWHIAPDYKKSPRILMYEELANQPN